MAHPYTRPRRSFLGRLLLIFIGVLGAGILSLFLLCAGLGVLVVWGAQHAVASISEDFAEAQRQADIEAARSTAAAFWQDVRDGNSEQAYDRSTAALQQRQSLTEWQGWLREHPELKQLRSSDQQFTAASGNRGPAYRVILVTPNGGAVGAVLDLAKDKDGWKVDRLTLP